MHLLSHAISCPLIEIEIVVYVQCDVQGCRIFQITKCAKSLWGFYRPDMSVFTP